MRRENDGLDQSDSSKSDEKLMLGRFTKRLDVEHGEREMRNYYFFYLGVLVRGRKLREQVYGEDLNSVWTLCLR